jgi:hypothetical protein
LPNVIYDILEIRVSKTTPTIFSAAQQFFSAPKTFLQWFCPARTYNIVQVGYFVCNSCHLLYVSRTSKEYASLMSKMKIASHGWLTRFVQKPT